MLVLVVLHPPYTAKHPSYFIIQQNLAPNLPMATLTTTDAPPARQGKEERSTDDDDDILGKTRQAVVEGEASLINDMFLPIFVIP